MPCYLFPNIVWQRLNALLVHFGGGNSGLRENFTGFYGNVFALLNLTVVWVLWMKYFPYTKHYWLSKDGICKPVPTYSWIGFFG
ncbi:hypothetical protein LINGRAHAP2_LOCUS30267 [Linum grandiflorum]